MELALLVATARRTRAASPPPPGPYESPRSELRSSVFVTVEEHSAFKQQVRRDMDDIRRYVDELRQDYSAFLSYGESGHAPASA